MRALCLHLTVLAGQVALISDRPRRGDTRHIVFAPERTQAHAEAGCLWLLWTEAFHSSAVMCSVWLLLAAAPPLLTLQGWVRFRVRPFGKGPDRVWLVQTPVLVQNSHRCVHKQADPRRGSEGKLQEHSFGGHVWLPVQASISWMLMKRREEVVRYKYVHLSLRAAGISAVGNEQLGVHSCASRLMLLVHTSVSISPL